MTSPEENKTLDDLPEEQPQQHIAQTLDHDISADGEELGMSLSPIKVPDLDFSVNANTSSYLTSPTTTTNNNNPNRRPSKRNKLKTRKLKSIEKKVKTLVETLVVVPFVPVKSLDFDAHEAVLKRLNLWDFVKIEFDSRVRIDLVSQLIVSYDPSRRCGYVNDKRIVANRADLSRYLKLPVVKKEKGSNVVDEVDLDSEEYSDGDILFIEEFVTSWIVLQGVGGDWEMPVEVSNSLRLVKDGHPEKVDWAGLLWQLVEKELLQGEKLRHCYYASHFQYLIKAQCEGFFENESQVEMTEVEMTEVGVKQDGDGGEENQSLAVEEENQSLGVEEQNQSLGVEEQNQSLGVEEENQSLGVEENALVEEPNIALTLGLDGSVKEEVKDDDIMDVDECSNDELNNWFSNGKNNMGGHMLQRCDLAQSSLDDYEKTKEEEEQGGDEEVQEVEEEDDEEVDEEEDGFEIAPNEDSLDREGLTGNFIQGMEATHIPFGLQGQLRDHSSVDPYASNSRDGAYLMSGQPLFFGQGGKREMEPEHDMSQYTSNKRMRTDGLWDPKPSDMGMCMDQIQDLITKAKMIHEEKEQTYQDSQSYQQQLLHELQQRDELIEQLRRSKGIDIAKKDDEIFRLESELYLMGNLIEGYKKALKDTQKAFSEYRDRAKLPEEPIYKDAGGGLVLSTTELEKQRQKQEEEDKMKRQFLKESVEEFIAECMHGFQVHYDKLATLDYRLMEFENTVKLLKEFSVQQRTQKSQDVPLDDDVSLQNLSDAIELPVIDASSGNLLDAPEVQANDASTQNPSDATELQVNDTGLQTPSDATELHVNDASLQNPPDAIELLVDDTSLSNPSAATKGQVNDTSPSDATKVLEMARDMESGAE